MKPHFQTICSAWTRRGGLAALAGAVALVSAFAQDPKSKAPAAPPPERPGDSEIARYCGALAPSASEARATYQMRRLADLEREVRDEVEKLEKKETTAREWVMKRESMMKSATEDVVAIYGKMAPEAAAAELAAMDEGVATAVLSKLNPRAASDILGEMPAEKAAKLSTLIAGAPGADKS
jgi:flagellar motility protein MotE (MotC chaperone)